MLTNTITIRNQTKTIANVPLHTGQNGRHKQINKQQVLERVWRKGNPSALFVGMQTGAGTVKNSMEFPQKN